jgi:hypothetical protein
MNTIQIGKSKYFIAETKIWLWNIGVILLVCLLGRLLLHWKYEKLSTFVFAMIVLWLGYTLTQYHIYKIIIGRANNTLEVHLSSIMSGTKTIKLPLDTTKANIKRNTKFKKFLHGSTILIISDLKKTHIRLTPRYSFTDIDLTNAYNLINSL